MYGRCRPLTCLCEKRPVATVSDTSAISSMVETGLLPCHVLQNPFPATAAR